LFREKDAPSHLALRVGPPSSVATYVPVGKASIKIGLTWMQDGKTGEPFSDTEDIEIGTCWFKQVPDIFKPEAPLATHSKRKVHCTAGRAGAGVGAFMTGGKGLPVGAGED
jgi:hypothetical protein